MPQDRAIDGPAVKPTTAPATAPIGPSTTAPDNAPKAASPTRSWAIAAEDISARVSTTNANVFFIRIPCERNPSPGLTRWGFLRWLFSGQVARWQPTPVVAHANGRLFSSCNYAPLVHRQLETDQDRGVNSRLAAVSREQLRQRSALANRHFDSTTAEACPTIKPRTGARGQSWEPIPDRNTSKGKRLQPAANAGAVLLWSTPRWKRGTEAALRRSNLIWSRPKRLRGLFARLTSNAGC